MATPLSFPPPAPHAPAPVPAARRLPVGDLKRLDSRRVIARLIDGLALLPCSLIAASTQNEGVYIPMLLMTLLYFFLCEATGSQTLGKSICKLRVMQRDGSAPTVNQISVRTVLRLIDDGPIGLIVIVLSGKRRQRIGDLLAGTTVGAAAAKPVPKPARSPLLIVYPVGWLIGAVVWLAGDSQVRAEEAYIEQASAVCAATGQLMQDDAPWPVTVAQLDAHRARVERLRPPESLAALHAELVAISRADVALAQRFSIASKRGDLAAHNRVRRRAVALNQHRSALGDAGLPACG